MEDPDQPSENRNVSADRPRVVVSRCLLGDRVRYDGGHQYHPFVVEQLGAVVQLIACCPEVELDMGVPREPIHLVWENQEIRLLGSTSRRDWTDQMKALTRRRVAEFEALGVRGAVLKARSPSCGVGTTPLLRGEGGVERLVSGLFASALQRALPDLPLVDELDLRDPAKRAVFVSQVFKPFSRC